MALPVTIPNTFANATASIPLSQLDTNFNTLANAVNGISDGSETLANASVTVLTAGTVDINGGAIDGTTVGTSNAAAGSFTTLNTSGAVVFNDAGADVDFRVEGDTDANLLFVDAGNDRVGMGTSAPARKLEVKSSTSNINYVRLQESTTNTPTDGGSMLELCGTRSTGAVGFYGGIFGGRTDSGVNNTGYLAFYADNNDGNSLTERMRIDSSGNVGIGTSSPFSKLDVRSTNAGAEVYGGIFANDSTSASSKVSLSFVTGSDGTAGRIRSQIMGDSDGSNNGYLSFYTRNSGTNTERMRIDSSGRLLVGTTAVGAITSGLIEVKFDGSLINGIFYNDTRTGAGNDNAAVFVRGSTTVGVLRTTTTDLSLVNLSDQRVKTNIQNSNSAIDLVDSVQVRQFDWTIDDSHEDFGFVAQELNEVFPQAVSVGKTEEEMWGVNLSKLVPVLTKAIQELKAELDTVKTELATLKG